MIQYAPALKIAIAVHAVLSRYNSGLSWLALIVGWLGCKASWSSRPSVSWER
jgi:hypothetical protein